MGYFDQAPKKLMRQVSAGFLILFLLSPYAIIKYGGLSMLIPVAVVLVVSYYFTLNEVIKRSVTRQEKAGKFYERSRPYVDIGTYLLLVVLFMLNAFLFEGEFKWLFISISVLVVIHAAVNYYIDSKYKLQKLVIDKEGLRLIQDIEQNYEWDWLKENAELDQTTLKLRGISRTNIKLDRFKDSAEAIAQIKRRLSKN